MSLPSHSIFVFVVDTYIFRKRTLWKLALWDPFEYVSGLESYDAVLKTFLAAKRDLGEILSSCEMIDSASLKISMDAYNLRWVIHEDFTLLVLLYYSLLSTSTYV